MALNFTSKNDYRGLQQLQPTNYKKSPTIPFTYSKLILTGLRVNLINLRRRKLKPLVILVQRNH